MITLRYIEISEELMARTAFQPDEVKDALGARAMARLGIAVPEGVRPIRAWLAAMATANGLPDLQPVHPELLAALEDDRATWRFFYALI